MIDTNLVNWPEERVAKLMSHYKEILSLLGEDPEREGLLKTPERVAKAMLTLTRGYEVDPKAVLNSTPDVLSYEAEVGEVKFGEGKAEIETAVWYDASGKNLRLVELSWKYRPGRGDEQNRALFQALQERTDVFDAGKLKSAN